MAKGLGVQAAGLLLSKFVSLSIALVSNMVLVRYASLNDFGLLSQILVATNTVTSLTLLGIPNSVTYFLARADSLHDQQQYLTTFFAAISFLGLFSGLVLVCASDALGNYFANPGIADHLILLMVLPWTTVALSSSYNILVVLGRILQLFFFQFLVNLIGLVLVLFSWSSSLTFEVYLNSYAILQSVSALSVYILALSSVRYRLRRPSFALLREILGFSIPLGVATVMGTLFLQLDKIIVGRLAGTEALAVYAVAGRELPLIIVATSITAVVFPRVVTLLQIGDVQGALRVWGDGSTLAFIVLSFGVSVLVFFSREVVLFLYSEKYLSGVGVFCIYVLHLLLTFTYFGALLNATGKTRAILWSSALALVANVVLSVGLFFWIGVVGPAIAGLVSTALLQWLQLFLSGHEVGVRVRALLPWGTLLYLTAMNIALLACAWVLWQVLERYFEWPNVGKISALIVCWGSVYAVIVWRRTMGLWRSLNSDKRSGSRAEA